MNQVFLAFLLQLLILDFCQGSVGANSEAISQSSERKDRAVDQVALQSLNFAAKKLETLLVKYHSTAQEPLLLFRLAEVQQEATQIAFRIAHALGAEPNSSKEMKIYHLLLNSQVKVLSQLIQRYPDAQQIDRAWFQRAKAYEEMERITDARLNYLEIIQNYKNSPVLIPSYLALAEIATQIQNHKEAISYLSPIEAAPKSIYYPVALYKLAWSHSNLGHLPQALGYLEKQILYYNAIGEQSPGMSPSDAAVRETSLLDSVGFYHDALEKKIAPYTLEAALPYFIKLENGSLLGKLALRFAKLLRAHREDVSLTQWKLILTQKQHQLPETLDVIALVLDHQLNQNQWSEMRQTLSELSAIERNPPRSSQIATSTIHFRQSLSESASQLQTQLQHTDGPAQKQQILDTLIQLDSILIEFNQSDEIKLGQIHLNLAEAYFASKKYTQASENYRWILKRWRPNFSIDLNTLELSWIRSRYEELKELKLFTPEISAEAIEAEALPPQTNLRASLLSKLPREAQEWINQIDESESKTLQPSEALNQMIFEANRIIYTKLSRSVAIDDLIRFATRSPQSQYAPPAVALALDTLIKSHQWTRTHEIAGKLFKIHWPKAELNERLHELELNSAYQVIEDLANQKDDAKTLIQASEYLKNYPNSPKKLQLWYLMAQSQLRNQCPSQAMNSLNSILNPHELYQKTSPEIFELALLQRASLYEKSFQFQDAIVDTRKYLTFHPNDPSTLKRLPILHWIVGDTSLECSKLFTPEILELCQKYQALTLLHSPEDTQIHANHLPWSRYRDLAYHGPNANRPLWAALILAHPLNLKLHELIRTIKILAQGWRNLEPNSQMTLLPIIHSILHQSISSARIKLRAEVPIMRITPQALVRRSEWIREFEAMITATLDLPWARIRANSLQILSEVYQDLIKTLEQAQLPNEMSPKNLKEYQTAIQAVTIPFTKKSQELSLSAYQIASNLSIENDDWIEIQTSRKAEYLKNTDELRKFLPPQVLDQNPIQIQNELVLTVDPSFFSDPLKKMWSDAIQEKYWARSLILLQELKNLNRINPTEEKILQAITWSKAGAKAEALSLLETILSELKSEAKVRVETLLMSHYVFTRSIEKTHQLWGMLAPIRSIP